MIYFLLARNNSDTIRKYLDGRGHAIADRMGILSYDDLSPLRSLSCRTIIFSDLEYLSAKQLQVVGQLYDDLKDRYPGLRLLNNPHRVKLRYELLRELYRTGINPFNVHRISSMEQAVQYPVFLREENHHTGALSGLIRDRASLERHALALGLQGYPSDSLLAVEYADVSRPDGIFRKYSALKVNDKIFPRQLDHNTHWMVKTSIDFNRYDENIFLGEWESFMHDHPHRAWLERVFDIAGIDYGRIDYGVCNGQPLVWEINLNPDYGRSRGRRRSRRHPRVDAIRSTFHEQLRAQWRSLAAPGAVNVELEIEESTRFALQPSRRVEFWHGVHNKFSTSRPVWRRAVAAMRWTCLQVAKALLPLARLSGHSPVRSGGG